MIYLFTHVFSYSFVYSLTYLDNGGGEGTAGEDDEPDEVPEWQGQGSQGQRGGGEHEGSAGEEAFLGWDKEEEVLAGPGGGKQLWEVEETEGGAEETPEHDHGEGGGDAEEWGSMWQCKWSCYHWPQNG